MATVGERVETWVCYGFPDQPLTSAERGEVIEYALQFEECTATREELSAMADHDLIRGAYGAMADYARGQM